MSLRKEFPILEYDPCNTAVIEPYACYPESNLPEYCVITFFRDAIERMDARGDLTQISALRSETLELPVYLTNYAGTPVCLVLGFLGSAGAAGHLEELIAGGCRKFIVCGGAGVLRKDIAAGHLIVPTAAVRDEGTSYHYAPPSREIACSPEALAAIEQTLTEESVPYIKAKTWTTDAIYRETREKVNLRISEGCAAVEMEAAALFAVAAFRGVTLGQILYGGDDLNGENWDKRNWHTRAGVRDQLVELSLKTCLRLSSEQSQREDQR